MALTISYTLVSLLGLDLSAGPSTVATDVAALSGGGFVGVGNFIGHTAVDLFDGSALHTGGFTTVDGTGASVVQLGNGNLLIGTVNAAGVASHVIRSLTGGLVGPEVIVATPEVFAQVDVASLGGDDFVIAASTEQGWKVDIFLKRVVDGVGSFSFIGSDGVHSTVKDPSVIGIGAGDLVVAYGVLDELIVKMALWAHDADAAQTPVVVDDRGTINRNPSVFDLPNAGFGMVYESNGQSNSLDVVLALFNDAGQRLATFDISNPTFASQGFDETSATASMLTDTLVAISYTQRSTATRTEPPVSKVALFDLTTNTVVARLSISSLSLTSSTGPLVVGLDNGQIAFFATNTSSGTDAFGRLLGAERTQTGDGADDVLAGDALRDHMFGGDGNDTMTGGRGAGDDMHGGLGRDEFRLGAGNIGTGEVIAGDGGGDRIILTGNARLDLAVLSSVEGLGFAGRGGRSATLEAGQFGTGLSATAAITGRADDADRLEVQMGAATALNLAGLVWRNWDTGTAHDRVVITGDTDAERLRGSVMDDAISMGGGADMLNGDLGRDVLTGGAGADRFVFATALGAGNVDRVTDFQTGLDQLRLDAGIFTGLARGKLPGLAFEAGAQASSARDRIIYDATTGAVFFDPDGTGAAAQQQFATLSIGAVLIAADVFVQ